MNVELLGSRQVVSSVDIHRIGLIAAERLAYRTTGGGQQRQGRRYYQRADVERLAAELRGETQ